jgi:hypothetical protein
MNHSAGNLTQNRIAVYAPGAASIKRFRLFLRVARCSRTKLDVVVAPPAPLRETLRAGRTLKNSQLIRRLPDDVIIICETADWSFGSLAVKTNQF